jgi:hypothetical protein
MTKPNDATIAVNDAESNLVCGGTVKFDTQFDPPKGGNLQSPVYVQILAYGDNGVLMRALAAQDPSATLPLGKPGPPPYWDDVPVAYGNLPASCVATLYYFTNQKTVYLASCEFAVAAAPA